MLKNNQAALVTGGAKRLGKAIALSLAKQGYDIALHYHHSEQEAKQTADEIAALDVNCHIFCHNLEDIAGIGNLVDDVFAQFPHCKLLVNNASVFEKSSFDETDPLFLQNQFGTNFIAPFFLTQHFARYCGKEGNVINMIDSYITKDRSAYFAYLLSKKVLADFTRMAAREIGPVRVNGICPGAVLTSTEDFDEAFLERKALELPSKTTPSVEDVVGAVHSILESPAMTGQLLFIDAGEHLL